MPLEKTKKSVTRVKTADGVAGYIGACSNCNFFNVGKNTITAVYLATVSKKCISSIITMQ